MRGIKAKSFQGVDVVPDQIRIEIEDPHGEWWALSLSFEQAEALRGVLDHMFHRLEQGGHVNRQQLQQQARKSHPHLFAS